MLLDILGFLLLLPAGMAQPRRLLYLALWTMPFVAGNMIGPFFIPYTPWRSAIYCYLFCVFIKSRKFAHEERLSSNVFLMLAFFGVVTAAGVLYSELYSPYLSSFTQSPLFHGFRVFLSEVIVWLLPLALLWHLREASEAPRLVRHALLAGVFYCALGILQFAVAKGAGYDLFPIFRGADDAGQVTQTVAGVAGTLGRINSICGEPRYLSLYCAIWFLVVVVSGDAIGLNAKTRAALAGLFLITNFLTVARSGLIMLAGGWFGLLLSLLFARRSTVAKRLSKLAVLLPLLVVVVYLESPLAEKGSAGYQRNIEFFGFTFPIEYQDLATLKVVSENPLGLVAGFGAGLWQYYADPFEDLALVEGFDHPPSFDSLKQNFAIVARVLNFGLLGLVLTLVFYRKLYRALQRNTLVDSKYLSNVRFLFLFWIVLLQLTTVGEAFMLIIMLSSASLETRIPGPLPSASGRRRVPGSLSPVTA